MRQQTVSLILSDDLGWDALRKMLQERQDVRIIGEAASMQEASATVAASQPDIVISAASINGKPVRHLLAELRQTCCPTTRFIVFATQIDPKDILPFAEIGVAGFLLWDNLSHTTLASCLETVLEGGVFVRSPEVVQAFIEVQQNTMQPSRDLSAAKRRDAIELNELTPREQQVLDGIARGWKNADIATDLCLQEQTVRRHVSTIYSKLGVGSRGEAILWGQEHGFGFL